MRAWNVGILLLTAGCTGAVTADADAGRDAARSVLIRWSTWMRATWIDDVAIDDARIGCD